MCTQPHDRGVWIAWQGQRSAAGACALQRPVLCGPLHRWNFQQYLVGTQQTPGGIPITLCTVFAVRCSCSSMRPGGAFEVDWARSGALDYSEFVPNATAPSGLAVTMGGQWACCAKSAFTPGGRQCACPLCWLTHALIGPQPACCWQASAAAGEPGQRGCRSCCSTAQSILAPDCAHRRGKQVRECLRLAARAVL